MVCFVFPIDDVYGVFCQMADYYMPKSLCGRQAAALKANTAGGWKGKLHALTPPLRNRNIFIIGQIE
jgi:hypothetical protein